MNLIYCSHMSSEVVPGVFTVDAILPATPESEAIATQYLAHIETDLGGDPDTERRATSPNLVLIDNGTVRLKSNADGLPGYKSQAKAIVNELKVQWIKDGAPTSVMDANGDPIVMDCDYTDKANLDGLVMIMGLQGSPIAGVRDHKNVTHVLTKAQISQMIQDMVVYVATTFYRKWQMGDEIEAATSLEQLEQIVGRPLA